MVSASLSCGVRAVHPGKMCTDCDDSAMVLNDRFECEQCPSIAITAIFITIFILVGLGGLLFTVRFMQQGETPSDLSVWSVSCFQ